MMRLRLEGISRSRGSEQVLQEVSLEVRPGELFFLLGPSGSGKTTLLRTVAGLERPQAGRIFFDEQDVTDLPPHRRGTGLMFQSYALWPHLDVAGNVAFGLEEQGRPRAEIARRVKETLATAGLAGLGRRHIRELSGGQQQRVALARALVTRPRCLLLDEPLSHLEPRLRQEMRLEIRRLCREAGITTIYVTHDQKEALSMADRLAVLHEGIIRQVGTPEELYRSPNSRFVAEFMGEVNVLSATIVAGNRARTSAGELCLLSPSDRNPGAKVLVAVRPESWRLIGAEPEANGWRGAVGKHLYLGDSRHYQILCGNTALTVAEPPSSPLRRAGETVMLTVAPEDIILLPPD